MRESRIRLLVLYANYTSQLSYFDDWLDAFTRHPVFSTIAVDIVQRESAERLRAALSQVDAVVLLHSTNGDTTLYLQPHIPVLADRKVPMLAFVGNEVNLPGSPIAEKRSLLEALHPEWIATQLLAEAGQYLFGDLASRQLVAIPHALNPNAFRPTRTLDDRRIDIGTRVASYVPHLGDNDRNRVRDIFVRLGEKGRLKVDISDAHYSRGKWANFLNRCRGTVSTEAGSWFLERDDATVNAIRDYVNGRSVGRIFIANDSRLRRFGHKLPAWVRLCLRTVMQRGPVRHESLVNERLPFDEVFARFFAGRPRPPVYGKCISSRHFDAVGTNTCQIMIRGRFNDILQADRHYLALDPELTNLDEVLRRFSDLGERRTIVDRALDHVMSAHTYAHRMRQIAALINAG